MEKELYDKTRKRIIYDIDIPFSGGLYGHIYKLSDDKCLKLFMNTGYRNSENSIEDIRAFETLNEMNLSNFYEVYKMLYDYSGYLVGYLMRYYESQSINILNMPTEYLLDNFNRLYETMLRISSNDIIMQDLHAGNVLLTDEQMIIIDADEYRYGKISNITGKNKQMLYNAFRDILLSALSKYYKSIDDKFLYMRGIDRLFNVGNGTKDINKKLVRYKKPIDYFRLNLYK